MAIAAGSGDEVDELPPPDRAVANGFYRLR